MNGHGSGQSWNFKEPKSSLQINRHVRWLLYTRELQLSYCKGADFSEPHMASWAWGRPMLILKDPLIGYSSALCSALDISHFSTGWISVSAPVISHCSEPGM